MKAKNTIPRNRFLPEGISLLRQLNAKALPTTLNLGLGKPEEDMPVVLRPLMQVALSESSLEYTENAGDLKTREALSGRFKLNGAASLLLTHGAQEGLMAALLATLNHGDEVLLPDPGFLAYAPMVRMLGAKPVSYTLKLVQNAYHHDLTLIKSKITSRTRAIILSSPGNPTGCDLEEAEFSALLKLIKTKKMIILSDEVYGMLHFKKPYFPLATLSDRVISVNSFSKSHALTGWRIGFVATCDQALARSCLVAHQYIATCASVPAQRFLEQLLKSPLFESVAMDYKSRYQNKLSLFREHSSPKLREKTPLVSGGFYLFPKLPKKQSSVQFCEELLRKENVLAVPGVAFGKNGEGSIRLSLALPDEQVIKAAQVLSKYY